MSPQIGFIGRLDYQKGVDILLSAAPDLMHDDVQLVRLLLPCSVDISANRCTCIKLLNSSLLYYR